MIRILVVDASPGFRALLKQHVPKDGDLEIIAETGDLENGLHLAAIEKPHVIALGVARGEGQKAIETTARIMGEAPVPIILLTDRADPEAGRVLAEASGSGAVAVESKPSPADDRAWRELRRLVRAMAEVKLVARRRTSSAPFLVPITALMPEVVAIGASTGGPPALSTLLAAVPGAYRGSILVAQHLQPGFTEGLARWLQLSSLLPVMIAERPVPLSTRSVILPPDGSHLVVDGGFARAEPGAEGTLVPSADRLFSTCAIGMRARAVGVLLTGMGADGAAGLKEMRRQGAWTIVQDESTSVVFGMPAAAAKEGAACEILPLPAIAQKLAQILEKGRPITAA